MGWVRPNANGPLVWRDAEAPPSGRVWTTHELEAVLPGALAAAERGEPGTSAEHDRETVARMTSQLVAGGVAPEQARRTATIAARRHDSGESIPYTRNEAAVGGRGGA